MTHNENTLNPGNPGKPNNRINCNMQKMFKWGAVCPYTGNAIDSPACRQCKDFFKAGTYTFIWCNHPDEPEASPVKKKAVSVPQSEHRKPGRPKKEQAKTGKRKTSPNKTRKTKK